MGKKCRPLILCLFLFCFGLLAGCMFNAGEELYALPQAPEDYLELQDQLNQIIAKGAEYAAPQSGNNTQTVQMVDIDGDGEGEAIAFFREDGTEKPLKIYIFRQTAEGYQIAAAIEGEGTVINSIDYSDITGDGWSEIVVSWQMSAKVQTISVYALKEYSMEQLLQTGYTRYKLHDMNQDGKMELLLFQMDPTGFSGNRADYYTYDNNELAQKYSAPLSLGIGELTRIKTGRLYDGATALFVDSTLPTGGLVTDILAVANGVFQNITLNETSGVSDETVRTYSVYTGDLDADGYLEVPSPEKLLSSQGDSLDAYWILHWNLYDSSGQIHRLMSTYHNYTDGWYLRLPIEWVGHITVSREDAIFGERTIVFSLTEGEQHTPFLKICKLTGANREERAKLKGRFILQRDSSSTDTIYVAQFINEETTVAYHLEEDALRNLFQLIPVEWNNE